MDASSPSLLALNIISRHEEGPFAPEDIRMSRQCSHYLRCLVLVMGMCGHFIRILRFPGGRVFERKLLMPTGQAVPECFPSPSSLAIRTFGSNGCSSNSFLSFVF